MCDLKMAACPENRWAVEMEWLTPQLPWIGDGGVDETAADATAEVASTFESLLGFGCWTAGDGEGLGVSFGRGG
jgi:hypothetical protein